MTDAPALPTYAVEDGVAVLTLDDGKVNVISHRVLDAVDDALDRAEGDGARALVIAGRAGGAFSAGFDLPTMTESTESMRGLVMRGAQTFMRLYGYRLPTVAACTGHALAAGALLLLSLDQRVGADVKAKIGLNEVQIGMGLPIFAVEMARERLPPPSSRPPPRRPGSTTRPAPSPPATSTGSSPPRTSSPRRSPTPSASASCAPAPTPARRRSSRVRDRLHPRHPRGRHGHRHRPRG